MKAAMCRGGGVLSKMAKIFVCLSLVVSVCAGTVLAVPEVFGDGVAIASGFSADQYTQDFNDRNLKGNTWNDDVIREQMHGNEADPVGDLAEFFRWASFTLLVFSIIAIAARFALRAVYEIGFTNSGDLSGGKKGGGKGKDGNAIPLLLLTSKERQSGQPQQGWALEMVKESAIALAIVVGVYVIFSVIAGFVFQIIGTAEDANLVSTTPSFGSAPRTS